MIKIAGVRDQLVLFINNGSTERRDTMVEHSTADADEHYNLSYRVRQSFNTGIILTLIIGRAFYTLQKFSY